MSTLMQWTEDGSVRDMSKDGTTPVKGDCKRARIRFLAGSGVTDDVGGWKLDLTPAVCGTLGNVQAVSFVATTTSPGLDGDDKPGHIRTGWTPLMVPTLYAYTWDCNCQPKPYTPFDYHIAIVEVSP